MEVLKGRVRVQQSGVQFAGWTVRSYSFPPLMVHHPPPKPLEVVFGKVTEGLSLVKKMEAMGSRTGKTSHVIKIADCGEVRCWARLLRMKAWHELGFERLGCGSIAHCQCHLVGRCCVLHSLLMGYPSATSASSSMV